MKEGQFDEKPLVKEIRKISQSFSAGTEIQEAEGVWEKILRLKKVNYKKY